MGSRSSPPSERGNRVRKIVGSTRRVVGLVTVLAAFGVVVGTAFAGTVTVGQAGANTGCSGDQLLVQTASVGPSYVIPSAGTVTTWSFAGGAAGSLEALVILRRTGSHTYVVVGSSPQQSVAAGTTGTFAANIKVQAGDLVGEWIPPAGSPECALIASGSDVLDHCFCVPSLPIAGTTETLFAASPYQLNMSVTVSSGSPWVPPPPHAAMCSVPGNTNPFTGAAIPPGTFLDLLAAQITTDPNYEGATPAIFVEGKGLTCDPPPPGYTQQGYAADDQHVASNFYAYWASPPSP